MSNRLKEAMNSLVIHDVYLRNSETVIAEGFEPKYEDKSASYKLKFKHFVEKAEILLLESDNDSGEEQLVRVFLQLGCRLLTEYLMKEPLEQSAIDEFATENASYHVWPYWREYLSSQCLRLNLPKIILPTKQLATNRQSAK